MKKLLFAALAVAAATAGQAQEARRQFGLGLSVNPNQAAAPTVEVYAPINVAPNFRIEPSLGIATDDEPSPGTDTRDITVGVGAFFVQRVGAPFDLYMGGRLKLNFANVERTTAANTTTSDDGVDVLVAAAIGGEHYFSAHFSLGAEAQLGFRSNSDASGDNSQFFTTGLGFLRFYF